ncbi:hypothetical protein DFH06DRAFT_1163856 [Mycena polygramma]|nr:hypothetical protein DFH06DRAFT_1163856 [Mycena polygramma]
MPPRRLVPPAAAVIALEVDRITISRRQKKLPPTFLQSFSVKDRLGDLSVDLLPDPETTIDHTCTKTLNDAELAAVKLANDALLLFSRLAYLVDHDNPTLRTMMLRLWDAGVWKWMLFLYNCGVDLNDTIGNEDRPLPTRQIITVGIVDALVGCADSVPLGKRLLLVPVVVSLIGRLWIEDLEIPGRPHMDGSIFSTLVGAVDGGAETIMQAATSHFRRLVSTTPLEPHDINSQAFFIEFLAQNALLRDAMHEADTLSVAVSAIDTLTKQSTRIRGDEAVATCLELILLPHLLSGTSVKPLIHSINKGLLRTLYDARVAFSNNEDCCEALAEVIIRIIGPSLIFRSVLHAVERSETKTHFFADYRSVGSEFHEWETLDEVYRELIRFRHVIDEELKPCGRLGCPTNEVDIPVKLQRCGRCQYRRYCSKECQQLDWPNHKRSCQKEPNLEIAPVSDREFAHQRAEFEVRTNMQSLRDRIQKNPALQTPKDLMFQVDFSTLNRDISIGVVPGGPQTKKERVAAIYARVQSGREPIRSLGLVTDWKLLQRGQQIGVLY